MCDKRMEKGKIEIRPTQKRRKNHHTLKVFHFSKKVYSKKFIVSGKNGKRRAIEKPLIIFSIFRSSSASARLLPCEKKKNRIRRNEKMLENNR